MAITLSTTSGSIDIATVSEILFSFSEPSEINTTTEKTIINIEVTNSINSLL
jgi:hypothetical protein|tara:strand:+ start:315 stop:470 length:156 start_codon:yes stop_codon:yes gene_type:complete